MALCLAIAPWYRLSAPAWSTSSIPIRIRRGRKELLAAFADAFIASNLDKRFQANAYAKAFLEDQLTQMKLRLEESEKALLDFGQKEQIVQTN